jgi:hypothetical protein
MRARRARGREVLVGVLLLTAFGASWADEAAKATRVTRLRTEKVALYNCNDGTKKTDFARKDFRDPWPIVPGSAPAQGGLLQVKVGDQHVCVRAYTVETDKPISASAECGAVVAMQEPKSAATRGLGGECKR